MTSKKTAPLISFIWLLLSLSTSHATTWIVQQEPGGHFVEVQEAINASSPGDTILVMPGTYYEHINLNGKNVVLTSRYLFTQDTYDINHTLLDGDHSGRVVNITSGENRNCQIIGFTIQNGYLPMPEFSGAVQEGAGILIRDSSPSIISCTIKNNHTPVHGAGGGVTISYNSSPFLSGLSVQGNSAGTLGGGGLAISYYRTYPEFDSLLKCSVYNNYAGMNNDIALPYSTENNWEIHLDTITASWQDDMILHWSPDIELTYEHTIIERVAHDLYVSPNGHDENSGLSFDEPLKTIQHALALIESDSLTRRTIFLNEGEYTPSNGQYFPLNIRSNIDLVGAGRDRTILDGENQMNLIVAYFDSFFSVRNMTIKNCPGGNINPVAMRVVECTEAEFKNIKLTENNGGSILQGQVGFAQGFEYLHPLETSAIFDSLEIVNNTCTWNTVFGTCKSTIVRNSIIRNTQAGWNDVWELYLNYPMQVRHTFHIENPVNIFQNIEVTQNENLEAWGPDYAIAMLVDGTDATVINSTFADNLLPQFMGGGVTLTSGAEVLMINSIVHGNTPNQIWLANGYNLAPNTIVVKSCLIEGAEAGVGQSGDNTVTWLDGNFSADPWFQGSAENPYYLAEGSPAIDAGTAFFVWEGDTIVNMSPDEYHGSAPDIGAHEWMSSSHTVEDILPEGFHLYGNYPNPFNGSTSIRFSVSRSAEVLFNVVDLKGRVQINRKLGRYASGTHQIIWDVGDLPSGLYLYTLSCESKQLSGKALVVK